MNATQYFLRLLLVFGLFNTNLVTYAVMNHQEALKILELQDPVTEESLKKQYKKLISQWHPDRFPGATPEKLQEVTDKTKNIVDAETFLSDELKKKQDSSKKQTSDNIQLNTAAQASQYFINEYSQTFKPENPLQQIDAARSAKFDAWNNVLAKIDAYIKMQLDKERSLGQGISESNRTTFAFAQKEIKTMSAHIKTIIRDSVMNGKKNAQNNINNLKFIADSLSKLQNSLKINDASVFFGGDVQDTKDIKKLLAGIASALEILSKKLIEKLQ